jgi:hypothetical protein
VTGLAILGMSITSSLHSVACEMACYWMSDSDYLRLWLLENVGVNGKSV